MPDLTLSSFVDTFLGSATQAEMRTNLALGTIATQAASAVAITGGTIAGVTGFESSATNFNVDSHGNLVAKYFKLNNSASGATSLYLGVVSGAVPSTAWSLSEVLRLTGGALYIQPAGTGTVISGALYLGGLGTVITGATNTLQIGSTSSSPSAQCIKGPNGSGTNIAGGKLGLAAGQSTGSATPAVLALQSTAAGSSGTTAQTLVDVMLVRNSQLIEFASGVILDGTGSGFRLGSTSATPIGFWGKAPVSQWAYVNVGGGLSSSGSGSAVLDDTTFTGSDGTKAYTIGDIVASLKACGILAQS